MTIKRILMGQSGGPTPVIDWEAAGIQAAANDYGIELLGAINGLEGVLHADTTPDNIKVLTGVDPNRWISNGPGSGLDTTRIKPEDPEYEKMVANLEPYEVDGIIYIGGNDSADQLLGLIRHNANIAAIHAIKTIDNDLRITHHCPGFGSAALYNAIAIKNVCNDFFGYRVRACGRVLKAPVAVYQVMGRKAGWLALATAFARVDPRGVMMDGRVPNIILSKENQVDMDALFGQIDAVVSKYDCACVVVQEDLDDAATGKSWEKLYGEEVEKDGHANPQHGRAKSFSPGAYLAQRITDELHVDGVDAIKEAVFSPQHVQRSCMMSTTDASEAYMIGYASVVAMLEGETGNSVILERGPKGNFVPGLAPLAELAGKNTRPVPQEYIAGMQGPTQDFVDEFIGTIGGPVAIPHYSDMQFRTAQLVDR